MSHARVSTRSTGCFTARSRCLVCLREGWWLVKVARRRVGILVRIRCLPALQGSAGSAWDVLSMGPQRNLRRLKSMNPQYQVWQAQISTPIAIP